MRRPTLAPLAGAVMSRAAISLAAMSLAVFSPAMVGSAAFAADLTMPSRIEAVTVFPDAAVVTRVGQVRTPAGEHVLILRGLPATIDPASIRIEAAADGPLLIGSADVRRVAADPQGGEDTQGKLRDLRGELARTRGRIEAIEAQKRAIADLTRIAAEAAGKDGGFDVEKARAAWTAVGEGTAAANERLHGEAARAADLEAKIRAVEAAAGRPRPGAAPLVDLAVAVEAGREVSANLTVSYRVGGARWTPLYDAALDTGGAGAAKVLLVRRAMISQRTGEDWTDVALTLSTARVSGGTAAPEMMTQAINLRDPAMVMMENRARAQAAPALAPLAAPGPTEAQARGADAAAFARAEEREATASASGFTASFAAPGRVSVSRDGAARTLRLSSHMLEAPLTARIAPSLDARAYLSTALIWTEDAPLLPGEVSLSRDGVFMGKGRIGLVAAGDGFDLGFGADDRIKVEHTPVRRRDNDPSGWNASRVQISDHRTVITNLHRRPMRITMLDRIPVSENSAIVIEPLPTNTAPTERNVQDRRGVMAWSHDLAPGEKREVRLGWRMRWPADRELMTQ
jgi:uncharacterized protein (TIGR02231 family)